MAAVKGTVVNGGRKPATARIKSRVLYRLTERGSFRLGMPAFVMVSSYNFGAHGSDYRILLQNSTLI
jgi:hypothetical protein